VTHDPWTRPPPELFEDVACYLCGSERRSAVVTANEDLTGKPGDFTFVRCLDCNLVYQHPRLPLEVIGSYYDDEYIAHRKQQSWGALAPFFEWLMGKLDRDKEAIVRSHVALDRSTRVLDVGCGAGGFLAHLHQRHGCSVVGVDFKDLSEVVAHHGDGAIAFHHGALTPGLLGTRRFDVITMWHVLEHDYDPLRSLAVARELLAPGGRLIIEVPRLDSRTARLYGKRWPGWQAPQHTLALDKERFLAMMATAGLQVVDYLPYGAYPGYFYVYAGAAFTLKRGRGIDLRKAIRSYLAGQIALAPIMAFERRLNLSMQVVVAKDPGHR
jgi:2-polyprenyl-3-methyl-5-hydroxy-6-metoxy-1,4-benzoquinol methylase